MSRLSFEELAVSVPALLPAIGREDPKVLCRLEQVSAKLRKIISESHAWRAAIWGPAFAQNNSLLVKAKGQKSASSGSSPGASSGSSNSSLVALDAEDEASKRALVLDELVSVFGETCIARVKAVERLRALLDRVPLGEEEELGEEEKEEKESKQKKHPGAQDLAPGVFSFGTRLNSNDHSDDSSDGDDAESVRVDTVADEDFVRIYDYRLQLAAEAGPHTHEESAAIMEVLEDGLISLEHYQGNFSGAGFGFGMAQQPAVTQPSRPPTFNTAFDAAFAHGSCELLDMMFKWQRNRHFSPRFQSNAFGVAENQSLVSAQYVVYHMRCLKDPRSNLTEDDEEDENAGARRNAVRLLQIFLSQPNARKWAIALLIAACSSASRSALAFLLFGVVSLPLHAAHRLRSDGRYVDGTAFTADDLNDINELEDDDKEELTGVRLWEDVLEPLVEGRDPLLAGAVPLSSFGEVDPLTTRPRLYTSALGKPSNNLSPLGFGTSSAFGSAFATTTSSGIPTGNRKARGYQRKLRQLHRRFSQTTTSTASEHIMAVLILLRAREVSLLPGDFTALIVDKRVSDDFLLALLPAEGLRAQDMFNHHHVSVKLRNIYAARTQVQALQGNNVAEPVSQPGRGPDLLDLCVGAKRHALISDLVKLGFSPNTAPQHFMIDEDTLSYLFGVQSKGTKSRGSEKENADVDDSEHDDGDASDDNRASFPGNSGWGTTTFFGSIDEGLPRVPLPFNYPLPLEVAIWNLDALSTRALLASGALPDAQFSRNPVYGSPSDLEKPSWRRIDGMKAPLGIHALLEYVGAALSAAAEEGDKINFTPTSGSSTSSASSFQPSFGGGFGFGAVAPATVVNGQYGIQMCFGVFASPNIQRWLDKDIYSAPEFGTTISLPGLTESAESLAVLQAKFEEVKDVVAEFLSTSGSSKDSYRGNDLHELVLTGSLPAIDSWLSSSSDAKLSTELLGVDWFGNTPLALAARLGRAALCRSLLTRGMKLHIHTQMLELTNSENLSPLLYAIWNPLFMIPRYSSEHLRQHCIGSLNAVGLNVPRLLQDLSRVAMIDSQGARKPWTGPGLPPCSEKSSVAEVIDVLTEFGADMLLQYGAGKTSLSLAVSFSAKPPCAPSSGFGQTSFGGYGPTTFGVFGQPSFGSLELEDEPTETDLAVIRAIVKAAQKQGILSDLLLADSRAPVPNAVLLATRLCDVALLETLLESGASVFVAEQSSIEAPLLYAARNLPDTLFVMKVLLKEHSQHHHAAAAMSTVEATDLLGFRAVHYLLRASGAGQVTNPANSSGIFGGPSLGIGTDPKEESTTYISQKTAAEFACRLINDCGASVAGVENMLLECLAPVAVLDACMGSPTFCAGEVLAVNRFIDNSYSSPSQAPHIDIVFEQFRSVHSMLPNMTRQQFGGSTGHLRLLLQNDWFGESRLFKSGPAALSAICEQGSKFVMHLLERLEVPFTVGKSGSVVPILRHILLQAAASGLAELVTQLCDAVRAANPDAADAAELAFVNSRERKSGLTALFRAHSPQVVKVLLARGADITVVANSPKGATCASFLSQAGGVQASMQYGGLGFANSSTYGGAFGNNGNVHSSPSARHCDPRLAQAEALMALLDAGASLAFDRESLPNGSVFADPVQTGDLHAVKSLVQSGAHPAHGNRRIDDQGNTLLHLAVRQLSESSRVMLQYLLFDISPPARLSPELQNFAGQTPLDLVSSQQHMSAQHIAQSVIKIMRRASSRLKQQLNRSSGDSAFAELTEFIDAGLATEADLFLRQSASSYVQSTVSTNGFSFGGATQTNVAPEAWKMGDIGATNDASEILASASQRFSSAGDSDIAQALEESETEEGDLKRRYERAQRRSLALRAVLFQSKLQQFDRGELPIDAKTQALFCEDSNDSAAPSKQETTDNSDDDGYEGNESGTNFATASSSLSRKNNNLPSAKILQVHALYIAWQENGLPKNHFNRYVKIQPPTLSDIWQFATPYVDWTNNSQGRMTANQMYELLVRGPPQGQQPAGFGFSQQTFPKLSQSDVAAYVLAIIRLNLGSCTQN